MTVRKRGGRKRALGTRAPMAAPQDRNLRWSLDFVADTLVSGRRFRILTLVDDFTRECLGLVVDTSLTGLRVARELDRIAELRSYPLQCVRDSRHRLSIELRLKITGGRDLLPAVSGTRSSRPVRHRASAGRRWCHDAARRRPPVVAGGPLQTCRRGSVDQIDNPVL